MIDLRNKELPDYITYDGKFYKLNTDYRIWLSYPDRMSGITKGEYDGYIDLFADDVAPLHEDTVMALNAFYSPEKIVPKDDNYDGPDLIDYLIDGDYIYSGFVQAYGIDLVDTDMHWHKFLALLEGLPDNTVMSKIISYRAYSGSSKDPGHKEYIKLQDMWALPIKYTEEEQRQMDEFEAYFGG